MEQKVCSTACFIVILVAVREINLKRSVRGRKISVVLRTPVAELKIYAGSVKMLR